MVLPVLNLGKLVGAMYLENRRIKREFPEKQVEVLRMLANDAAIAIENARMYQQLEEMVERRTEKLRESYSELMAVNSHKDKIIQIVSHDIRSPLSAVAEMASTLQDEDVSQDPETVVKNAGIIQRSVKTTLNMVNDILDLAKLESGKVILNYSKVNLKDFLKQAAQMQDPQIQQKNINLQMNPGEDCRISVDPSKMTQALGNLLSNAIKFTPSGGDVIMGYDLADYDGQQYARIQVADTGMGMSQEQLTTLFEKFNKTQRKGTRGEKGTGLGLSIAKEIIELHHGEIHVESDEGIGTTFTVLLPLEPPQQDGQANASGA
jgi:signal transduction histidine kinase